MVVSKEDMHNSTLDFMYTNLVWKDDESEPMTIKTKPVKEAIGRSTHTVDLSTLDLSLSILATTSRNKGEIQRDLFRR